jgi:hypothetical protein
VFHLVIYLNSQETQTHVDLRTLICKSHSLNAFFSVYTGKISGALLLLINVVTCSGVACDLQDNECTY